MKEKPIIFTCDQVSFSGPSKKLVNRSRDWFLQQLLKRTSSVWVPGQASRGYVQDFGVPPERIFQGAYCIDVDHLKKVAEAEKTKRETIRRTLGIGPDEWLFLFVGRMIPIRGLRYLLEAYAEVRRQTPSANLLLIGIGPERDWLESTSKKWHLQGIKFLDPMPIDIITSYYVASDTYVISSINEMYSLALVHGAICGLPIIATDRVGAVSDYVFEGETGLVVPAEDSHCLAKAMLRMITSQEQAKKMGQRAKIVAQQRNVPWAAQQLENAVFKAIEINNVRLAS
jgi:glycosyltransferase involved in cell wall biosynthesis